MATSTEGRALPYGLGHITPGWVVVSGLLLAVVGLGAYAYSLQVTQGESVTGLRDLGTMGGAPWGLYVAFELYAVGVGFGAMVLMAVVRLSGLDYLWPLTRPLGLTALAALVLGGLSVIADVGQPLRALLNLPLYARPWSPFFGTFTIGMATALIAAVAYLYLDSRRDAALLARQNTRWGGFLRLVSAGYSGTPGEERRHRQASLAMAIVLLVVGVAAASTSAFVFGVQLGRPGWYSALQAPSFAVLAGIAGTGIIIIAAAALRLGLGETERLNMRAFAWLSNFMTALTLVYLYFLLAELLTANYSGHHHEERLNQALLSGQYAWLFWLAGGLFLAAFLMGAGQVLWRRYSLPLIVLAGVLVNMAAIGKRYLIVVPSQTASALLPYDPGSYTPSWVEYAVVLGLLALGALLYLVFMKVFPILEVSEKP